MRPKPDLRSYLPLLISGTLLLVLLAVMVVLDAKPTQGHLYYPLDDAYIHMAISKNVATHGVWGATQYHFAAASSSILYTVVLAGCFRVFGVHDMIPLILGAITTLLVLFAAHRWLWRLGVGKRLILLAELLLVLVIPLPAMALLGMEHGFQLLFILVLGFYGADIISADAKPGVKQMVTLALLGAVAEGFRFESAFLVVFLIAALWLRKRFAAGFALGFGTVLPVAIFGWFSHAQGWPWLPAPILIKGNTPHGGSIRALLAAMGGTAIRTLAWEPLLLFLMILTAVLFFVSLAKGQRLWGNVPVLLMSFAVTCFLHLQFASVGWFMRYEMYLIGYGIVVNTVAIASLAPESLGQTLRRLWAPAAIIALFVAIPMVQRSFNGFKKYVQSGRDRWEIHVRPALFVKKYYNDSTVVVNDLGAMSFYTDAHVIDIYGLGDLTPLQLRHSTEGYNKASVEKWISGTGATVAVIQTGWAEVRDKVPDSWVQVGKIQAERNVVWGDLDIGFFSIPPGNAEELKRNLGAFQTASPE